MNKSSIYRIALFSLIALFLGSQPAFSQSETEQKTKTTIPKAKLEKIRKTINEGKATNKEREKASMQKIETKEGGKIKNQAMKNAQPLNKAEKKAAMEAKHSSKKAGTKGKPVKSKIVMAEKMYMSSRTKAKRKVSEGEMRKNKSAARIKAARMKLEADKAAGKVDEKTYKQKLQKIEAAEKKLMELERAVSNAKQLGN